MWTVKETKTGAKRWVKITKGYATLDNGGRPFFVTGGSSPKTVVIYAERETPHERRLLVRKQA